MISQPNVMTRSKGVISPWKDHGMVGIYKETYKRDQFCGVHIMAILRSPALGIGKSAMGCWSEETAVAAVVSVRVAPWTGSLRWQRVGLRCGSRVFIRVC